ncbi:MAG TPA: DNA gyrase inhibitor YacG [Candidatus Binatia bacterium]|nr:DNA gyrase inhibitor YacG [Candidatus Binatia bacterium]
MPEKVKCPRCRAEATWEGNPHRPFCSERCQLIDLGAWTTERYRIPAHESEIDPDDEDDSERA